MKRLMDEVSVWTTRPALINTKKIKIITQKGEKSKFKTLKLKTLSFRFKSLLINTRVYMQMEKIL